MGIVCVFSKSSSARSRWSLGSPRPVAATTQNFGDDGELGGDCNDDRYQSWWWWWFVPNAYLSLICNIWSQYAICTQSLCQLSNMQYMHPQPFCQLISMTSNSHGPPSLQFCFEHPSFYKCLGFRLEMESRKGGKRPKKQLWMWNQPYGKISVIINPIPCQWQRVTDEISFQKCS